MSRAKRQSDQYLRLRLQKPRNDRETLLPCPACDGACVRVCERCSGSGTLPVDDLGSGQYRRVACERCESLGKKKCRWCAGTGAVPHQMLSVFHRWRGILRHNRGRCG